MAGPAPVGGLLEAAEAALAAGRPEESGALFDRVIVAARAAGDLDSWTRAVLGLAASQRFGPDAGRLPALLAELRATNGLPNADRARVDAALARSWVYAGEAGRAVPFGAEALELARDEGDAALLADALDAALTSRWGPGELALRGELAAELDAVAAHLLDPEARLRTHLWGFTVAFEHLDVLTLNRQARALELLGEESAKARFFAASRRLALDLMRGRLDTADQLIAVAESAAAGTNLPDAPVVVLGMRGYTALHRGDAVGCAAAAEAAQEVADSEGLPTIAAEAAPFWAAAGEFDRARTLVFRFDGPALAAIPRDVDWLLVLQCLLDVALAIGQLDAVAQLTPLLEEFPGRAVVNAGGFMFHGVTDDPLSRAHQLLGATERAAELRGAALDRYQRVGANWWLERLRSFSSDGPSVVGGVAGPREATRPVVFREAAGGTWEIGTPGATQHLPAMLGFRHLRRLLAQPGAELSALDLAGAGTVVIANDLGPRLDATAARAYRARLGELDEDLGEAEDWADEARLERLRDEREALLAELGAAFGLGGAPRAAGTSAERARVAVRKSISAALARLADVDGRLAAHLRTHVHTGNTCSYEPEPGWEWILD